MPHDLGAANRKATVRKPRFSLSVAFQPVFRLLFVRKFSCIDSLSEKGRILQGLVYSLASFLHVESHARVGLESLESLKQGGIPSPTICFIFLGEYEHIWFRVPSHRTHLDCRHTLDSQFQLSIKNSLHPPSFRELQQSVCHSHQQKSPSQTVKS